MIPAGRWLGARPVPRAVSRSSELSRRPVQPRPDPRHRLVLSHPERSFGGLDLVADAPARDKRAGERWIGEVDRDRIVRVPEGVIAQPSAPQFSSSQAVICVYRWPRPFGGSVMGMRGREAPFVDVVVEEA